MGKILLQHDTCLSWSLVPCCHGGTCYLDPVCHWACICWTIPVYYYLSTAAWVGGSYPGLPMLHRPFLDNITCCFIYMAARKFLALPSCSFRKKICGYFIVCMCVCVCVCVCCMWLQTLVLVVAVVLVFSYDIKISVLFLALLRQTLLVSGLHYVHHFVAEADSVDVWSAQFAVKQQQKKHSNKQRDPRSAFCMCHLIICLPCADLGVDAEALPVASINLPLICPGWHGPLKFNILHLTSTVNTAEVENAARTVKCYGNHFSSTTGFVMYIADNKVQNLVRKGWWA